MSTELPIPETRYAETDGLSIAYQVFGSGAQDLVFVPGIVSHIEANWQYDNYARMLRRLGRHFRVIFFDKRGQGMSDRFDGVPTLGAAHGRCARGDAGRGIEPGRALRHFRGRRRWARCSRPPTRRWSSGWSVRRRWRASRRHLTTRHSPTLERMLQAVADSWGTPAVGADVRAQPRRRCRLLRAHGALPAPDRIAQRDAASDDWPMTRSTCVRSCRRSAGRR